MVRQHADTQVIANLFEKNTPESTTYGESERIEISSNFQRGDEETGVWSDKQKCGYIESLTKSYPTGILTMVRDAGAQTQPAWKVLDGGNRLRAIRDFKKNVYKNVDGMFFEELTPEQRAQFNTINIPCQWMTLETNDARNTIAEMFTRLNTTSKPLSNGELYKAHGWKDDCWPITYARRLISGKTGPDERLGVLRTQWIGVFKELNDTKRCDNLAMMVGYIVSAVTGDFQHFEKSYSKNASQVSTYNAEPIEAELTIMYKKMHEYLNIMKVINNRKVFGNITKGMPSQSKVAPVWNTICGEGRADGFTQILITFYQYIVTNDTVLTAYSNILSSGGDNHATTSKINKVLDYIRDTPV